MCETLPPATLLSLMQVSSSLWLVKSPQILMVQHNDSQCFAASFQHAHHLGSVPWYVEGTHVQHASSLEVLAPWQLDCPLIALQRPTCDLHRYGARMRLVTDDILPAPMADLVRMQRGLCQGCHESLEPALAKGLLSGRPGPKVPLCIPSSWVVAACGLVL